jgi:hypothetical protein
MVVASEDNASAAALGGKLRFFAVESARIRGLLGSNSMLSWFEFNRSRWIGAIAKVCRRKKKCRPRCERERQLRQTLVQGACVNRE